MFKTKTKIVGTLSNFRKDKKILKELISEGMDVIRLNFSHMNLDDADVLIKNVKEIRREMNIPLAIMLDTKGPEVRIYGHKEKVKLEKSDIITISSYLKKDLENKISPENLHFYTNLPDLPKLVKIGSRVLLMDGFIEGLVKEIDSEKIHVEILNNGALRPKAHLSIPNLHYDLDFLSEKDIHDITYAVKNDLEYIALSFVQSSDDIFQVKQLIREVDMDANIKLISKIENKFAINNLDEIIRYSDGVMVARGDLGVELPLEEVPIMQKKIIRNCYLSGKPVITATQMLESMIDNRVPTRAEASDVANACYDLTSAVMLSGETAVGNFPALVVRTMERIIRKVEASFDYSAIYHKSRRLMDSRDLTTIISYNAVATATQSQAAAIIVFSTSGYSAQQISKLRPGLPVYTFTPNEKIYNQLALNWGIFPYLIEEEIDFEDMLSHALKICEDENLLKKDDMVVIVAGLPLGAKGRTNMIRVETIGKSSIAGRAVCKGSATGQIVHIRDENDLKTKDLTGKVIVLQTFKQQYTNYLRYINGIVMEGSEFESSLQILGMAYNIPILLDAFANLSSIKEGVLVEINSKKQLVIEI